VGYSGGTRKNPTYHSLGDHSETLQIDYDPSQVSYPQLLAIFWAAHSPQDQSWSRQYRNVLFYHDEEQKRLALESKIQVEAKVKGKVLTEILPAAEFYLAEDYHQKYYLRGESSLLKEFKAIYPKELDFVNSTAAARANGFMSGYGDLDLLKAEVNLYGLSAGAQKRLIEIASSRRR
jgi:peptide-methionine (S)-S-oxide reductase